MPCIDSCSMPCCARQWICCKCPMHMHSFSLRMTLSSSACFRACFCLLASVLASCAAACAMPGHAAACGAQRSAMRCRMQHAACAVHGKCCCGSAGARCKCKRSSKHMVMMPDVVHCALQSACHRQACMLSHCMHLNSVAMQCMRCKLISTSEAHEHPSLLPVSPPPTHLHQACHTAPPPAPPHHCRSCCTLLPADAPTRLRISHHPLTCRGTIDKPHPRVSRITAGSARCHHMRRCQRRGSLRCTLHSALLPSQVAQVPHPGWYQSSGRSHRASCRMGSWRTEFGWGPCCCCAARRPAGQHIRMKCCSCHCTSTSNPPQPAVENKDSKVMACLS